MQGESNSTCKGRSGEGDSTCLCPIGGLLNVLSRRWSLQVMTQLGNMVATRFNQLQKNLPGISPRTLTDRLKDLGGAGLVRREAFAEIPPRVEYTLTQEGRDLRNLMVPLIRWVASRDLHSTS